MPDQPKLQIFKILAYSLAGALLLLSWLWNIPPFWQSLDESIFRFFNQFVDPQYPVWIKILAILNTRLFDFISAALMCLLLLWSVHICPRPDRWRYWITVSVLMVGAFLLISALCEISITYRRPSPTATFDDSNRLRNLIDIRHRDISKQSFPSDHGVILMIFVAFLFRFARRQVAAVGVLLTILLSSPRIMVGAHWFTDVYVGALSTTLLTVPWLLLSPLADWWIRKIRQHLDRWLDKKRTST